ncbi:RrF2 family transcriptional regulator [Candidatus Enterococcus clewellii]|uniref:Rrf2 family protein n=1 Tax=Candidatus Enterococcus clewellii TaxID=1834193 RepID=A0AAQ3VZH2_9ENTE|nr:Rrf2 family transcriptional regulator [Enterococcus sp. 9E7_DIV0242]
MSYSGATFQGASILVFIHFKSEEEKYDFLSAKVISEMLNIPTPTVVKILGKLKKAGLIVTKEGARGGNHLARPINEMTLYDVFHAVEQGTELFRTYRTFNMDFDNLDAMVEKGISSLKRAEKAMEEELASVRISDLID